MSSKSDRKSSQGSSSGRLRGRRGSRDAESVQLESFGDKPSSSRPNNSLELPARDSIKPSQSMTVLEVPHVSRNNSFESDRQVVWTEDDDQPDSVLSGETDNSREDSLKYRRFASTDETVDGISVTLLNFRRFSKISVPVPGGMFDFSDDEESDKKDPVPKASQIVTRKVVQGIDGKYRLETRNGQKNRLGSSSSRSVDLESRSLTDASSSSSTDDDRLSLPNSRMRYDSDPAASGSGSAQLEDGSVLSRSSSGHKEKRKGLMFKKAPGGVSSLLHRVSSSLHESSSKNDLSRQNSRGSSNELDLLY